MDKAAVSARVTGALAALDNPYNQAKSGYRDWCASSSTYRTTVDGYALSSTYLSNHELAKNNTLPEPQDQEQHIEYVRPSKRQYNAASRLLWLTPGDRACDYPGCTFKASRKSLELHKMDRHLIYPMDWQEEKRWDGDISLKGRGFSIKSVYKF